MTYAMYTDYVLCCFLVVSLTVLYVLCFVYVCVCVCVCLCVCVCVCVSVCFTVMQIKTDVKTAAALLDQFHEKRRLLVVSTPNVANQYYKLQNIMIQVSH